MINRLYNPNLNIILGLHYINTDYNIQVFSLNLEVTNITICANKALMWNIGIFPNLCSMCVFPCREQFMFFK